MTPEQRLQGFVCLWRCSLDSQVWRSDGLWRTWCWCLMKASHKSRWVPVSTGRGVTQVRLEPGQFIFGRHSAAKELKHKAFTIYKRMLKLEKSGNLTTQNHTHYSLITICNWNDYQTATNGEGTGKGTAKEQPRNTNNNVENVNNDKDKETEVAPSRKKPVSKPPAIKWSPDGGWENIAEKDRTRWAEAYPACNIDTQLARMTAWLVANPAKAHKSNWQRFIVNWLRKEQDRGGDATSARARSDTAAQLERIHNAERRS